MWQIGSERVRENERETGKRLAAGVAVEVALVARMSGK